MKRYPLLIWSISSALILSLWTTRIISLAITVDTSI
jgi:hypothetical protein